MHRIKVKLFTPADVDKLFGMSFNKRRHFKPAIGAHFTDYNQCPSVSANLQCAFFGKYLFFFRPNLSGEASTLFNPDTWVNLPRGLAFSGDTLTATRRDLDNGER